MKTIGIISDTHSYIDDKVLNFFDKCDYIFHAGDIGNIKIVDKLNDICKTFAVYGNIDGGIIRTEFNAIITANIESVKILMTHIGGYPNKYSPGFLSKIKEHKPDMVITGHSHILKVLYDKKLNHLHVNPGAYGKSGFHKMRTAIRLNINNENFTDLEVLEIPRKEIVTL